ncbi:hypothetical protein Esi_0017_0154 [Ectocarpus siliculosus]|uniref:Uncharacterized protein n=1 Tax=Ectocarpus siliculosus TaxID=2880 RepID=D7FMN6_ECTSI|nr:hypothetical protein Esi_0017_0154 [Ectocarpus siliculosus]|eukprot:CBJ25933.1 hypothetical protein Esi_0017_0154 [Ectocarpus siliculosus]
MATANADSSKSIIKEDVEPRAIKNKGTLEFALRPYRIPAEVLREKHEAVLGMITIFLGGRLKSGAESRPVLYPTHARHQKSIHPEHRC